MFITDFIEKVARNVFWTESRSARNMFWSEVRSIRKQWDRHPTIRVKLDDGAKIPVRAHDTDAGADLCCMEDVTIQPGNSVLIDTGVHVELPEGTVGMLKSKSGLNCMAACTTTGVIDQGYTGPIKVRVYNHGSFPREFKGGDKVTQLVVMPVIFPSYEVSAEDIKGSERGANGFGSTGR